ncbi:MAG: carboxymuconolactone decarboxylase family protein [Acidimicrobiales bacterium]
MTDNYPKRYNEVVEMMRNFGPEASGVMEGFSRLHSASVANGALSSKIKELIALAIGITVRCDGCIAFHVHDALKAGATPEEVAETIGVAIMMGGGPSVVYGCEAWQALKEFEQARLAA